MPLKVVIVTLIGAASIAAAATGGYIALRQNAPKTVTATTARNAEASVRTAPAPETASVDPPAEQPATTLPAESPAPTAAAKTAEPAVAAAVPVSGPLPPVDPVAAETREARPDPAQVSETPKPHTDVTIASDSVIGIRLDSALSSETARVEDKVTARVTRDVVVDGRTAISSGARLEGVVDAVEHAGKFKDRARLGVRFQSIVLADGTRLPIVTETIFREGDSPTGSATSKVGASAAIGGILGAVIGGKKGAAIGSSVGAAGGTAAVMAGTAPSVMLHAGTPLTVRLTAPITVAVERQQDH